MNYWNILGITPTTDKRTIKKAYAKRLTEYHPEDQPEKFEEIKKAYQAALDYANYPDDYTGFEEFEELEEPAEYAYEPFSYNDNIFNVDIAYEEKLKKEQDQMYTVLNRLSYLLALKDKTYTDSGKKRKIELLTLINEGFLPYKDNPVFINNLASMLIRCEKLNYKHVRAIKKVFGIKGSETPVFYDKELDYALYQLNKVLKPLPDKNSGNTSVNFLAIIFGIFILVAVQIGIGRGESQRNPTVEPRLPRASNLHYMGNAYRTGRRSGSSVIEQDYEQALYWYRRAAEQYYAPSQFNIGLMYANGQGVLQSYEEALIWFEKAALQGHSGAKYSLGLMYDQGHGVIQSHKEAAFWYRKAAEQGHVHGQNNLAILYLRGHGLEMNQKQAAYWFRKAAEAGDAYAQLNLGLLYETGQGVPQNTETAIYWYELAAAGGAAPAEYALNRLLEQPD